MVRYLASVIAALLLIPALLLMASANAQAAEKIAAFPFAIIDATKSSGPMGYDLGGGLPTGPNKDELRRLKLISDDLVRRIAEDGRYELVASDKIDAEVQKSGPIHECNGCEDELAKRLGADLALIATVEKLSDLLFNFNLYLRDVSQQKVTSIMSTTVQGSNDEAWLRGVRYLAERKLLQPGDAK